MCFSHSAVYPCNLTVNVNFFKTTTLSVAGERFGVRRVTRKGFVSEGTLRLIDKSSREARLHGDPRAEEAEALDCAIPSD